MYLCAEAEDRGYNLDMNNQVPLGRDDVNQKDQQKAPPNNQSPPSGDKSASRVVDADSRHGES